MADTAEITYEEFMDANQAREDEKLLVRFYIKAVPDQARSEEEGRPIFKDVEYVHISVPGSRDAVARPASPHDKERFSRHYAAFKNRHETPQEGTPLTEWPLITRSQAEELAFFNVKTVEHLADMADVHVSKFMGLHNLKRQAQEWLADTKQDADMVPLVRRLEEAEANLQARDNTIQALTHRLNELEARLKDRNSLGSQDEPVSEITQTALDEPNEQSEGEAPPESEQPIKRIRRRRKRGLEDS